MKSIVKYAVAALLGLASGVRGADALDTWATNSIGAQNISGAVAYGNGLFVGVGAMGAIVTSTDGMNWRQRNSPTGNFLQGLTYANGQFVAVGTSTTIVTSPDGFSWTAQDSKATNNASFFGVTYGAGRFVTGGDAATICSSPDGVNWTPWYGYLRTGIIASWNSAAYGDGRFVALSDNEYEVGSETEVTSINGIDWRQVDAPGSGCQHLAFGNGVFVAAGFYANGPYQLNSVIYSSADGLNWTLRLDLTQFEPPGFTFVTYGGGEFAAGGPTVPLYSSSDGTNWVWHAPLVPPSVMAYGNGQFVGVAGGTVAVRSGVIGKLGASLSPADRIEGTITGVTGQTFAIEGSTDLSGWLPVTNITVNSNGVAQFAEPANMDRRFYQATLVR